MATEFAAHTLSATSADWQREFIISGIIGLAVFFVALLFLRELSPKIRDQLMVTERDPCSWSSRPRASTYTRR